ncbi:2-keto-3-deoxygluconate permease [Streptomyces sp. enrichment culture]|uniref:2-keto-3-deoxygluconate permease n=1 Tax=Streptomyces sp. enrichment culture TaxID=1795815 RepID=UPI003F56F846
MGRLLGESPVSDGAFAGLSTPAVVAALNDTNGGLCMSLTARFGRKRDVGADLSAFPRQTLVGAIPPSALGMLLGDLAPGTRRCGSPRSQHPCSAAAGPRR